MPVASGGRLARWNPVDWQIATGELRLLARAALPSTMGADFAGEVADLVCKSRSRQLRGQSFLLAISAPCASAASFAQTTSGSTPAVPTWMLNPQSVPAITLSRPTRSA